MTPAEALYFVRWHSRRNETLGEWEARVTAELAAQGAVVVTVETLAAALQGIEEWPVHFCDYTGCPHCHDFAAAMFEALKEAERE